MKTSKMVHMSGFCRFIAVAAALFLLGMPFSAQAVRGYNKLQGITTTKAGAVTKIYLQLKSKPTFTVYRLERPTRVIVDLSNTVVKGYEDPVDVDSWAVRSISVARFSHSRSTIARVVIGFRRAASYSVKARKNRVVVTVTAHSLPPKSKAKQTASREMEQAKKEALLAKKAAQLAKEKVLEEKRRALRVAKETAQARSQAQKARQLAKKAQIEAAQARSQAKRARSLAFKAKSQTQRAKKEMEAFRHSLLSAKQRAKSLNRVSLKTARKLAKMKSKLQQLKAEALEAHQKLKRARHETSRLKSMAKKLRGTASEAQAKLRLARARARQAKAQKKAAQAEAKRAFAARQAAHQAAKAAFEEVKKAKKEAQRLRKIAKNLKGTAQEAKAKILWAQAEARAARLEVTRTKKQAKDLKSRVANLKYQEKVLARKSLLARKRAEKLKTRNAWLKAKAAKARWQKARRAAAVRQAEKVKADLRKTRAEASRVRAELRRLKLEAVQAKRQASLNKREAAQSKRVLSRLSAKVRSARGDMKKVKDLTKKAAERFSFFKKEAAVAHRTVSQIKRELHRLEHRRQALRVESEQLSRRVKTARKLVVTARQKASRMEKKLLATKSQVRRALRQVDRARSRVNVLRQRSKKLQGKSRGMKRRLAREQRLREMALKHAERKLRLVQSKFRKMRANRASAESEKLKAKTALGALKKRKQKNIALEKAALNEARQAYAMQSKALEQKRKLEKKVSELLKRHRLLVAMSRTEKKRQKRLRGALIKLQSHVSHMRQALKEEQRRAEKARQARKREEKLAGRAKKARYALQRYNRILKGKNLRLKRLEKKLVEEKRTAVRISRSGNRRQRRTAKARWRRFSRTTKRQIAALQNKLARMRARRKKAASIVKGISRKHELANRTAEVLEKRLNEAQKDLRRVNEKKALAERAVSRARRRLEETLQKRKQEQILVRKLEKERRAQSAELRELRARSQKVRAQMSQLRRSLEAEKSEVSKLGCRKRHVQNKIRKVEKELRRLREQKSKELVAGKRLQRKRRFLERKLAEAKARLARAQKARGKKRRLLERKLAEAKARLARAQKARRKKKRRLGKKRSYKVTAKIASVKFRDTGATHRIVLKVDGPFDYNIQRSQNKKVLLRIYGARLPKKFEKSLDTSAFRGPVGLVSSYASRRHRGAVDLLMKLKQPARFRINQQGKFLWVDFVKGSRRRWRQRLAKANKRVPKGAAVEVSSSRVGGYSSKGRPMAPRRRYRRTLTNRKYSVRGHNLGPRVDMDFKDADLHNVLRLIGQVWKKNIVIPDDVSGRVTIRMVNVRVGRALEVVLKSKKLGLVWEGARIIRVAQLKDILKQRESIREAKKIEKKEQPTVMRVIRLSYADADKVAKQLKDNVLSKKGNVSANKRTNSIIIRDVVANINVARKLIRTLDTPTPQVLIEARIVEARSSFLREVGVQWGGSVLASPATGSPTGLLFPFSIGASGGAVDNVTQAGGLVGAGSSNPAFAVNLPATTGSGQGGALGLSLGTLGGVANINLRLSAMEETGQVRIISAPKITTLDNVEAKIEQGTRIPISVVSAQGVNTKFEEATLGLTVTPHVTADNRIRLKMEITKNEPDFVNTGARGDPTILKKKAQSEMLIPDGDTAVIGGIYTRQTSSSFSKVPWFADIPIIGWLFKKKKQSDERSELLIFVTPRIIKPGKIKERKAGR